MSEELYTLYEKSIENNLKYLMKLEKELTHETNMNSAFSHLLSLSSKNLANKWRSGAKYLRTRYAKQAIPNYPDDVLMLLISVDASVNLLEDILDETLSKEQKGLYLVELIRVLSMQNSFNLSKKLQKIISDYFNKIIFIAGSENFLYPQILNEKDESKLFELCTASYSCRSLDMDIFVELPLTKNKHTKQEINSALIAARSFRVINLAKKDIADLPHDLQFNTTTPIMVMKQRNLPVKNFIDALYSK
ncbi:MAG: hypothetical protein AB1468_01365, partial [Candidatus Micrarchaeota archaeon]